MRVRFLLAVLPALLLGAATGVALGAKAETGASHATLYKGSDPSGAVTFAFNYVDHIHKGQASTGSIELLSFRFANGCAAHGTKVPGGIRVRANDRFAYSAHGITVMGRLVGGSYLPRKIVGEVSFTTAGCDTDELPFSAKPTT